MGIAFVAKAVVCHLVPISQQSNHTLLVTIDKVSAQEESGLRAMLRKQLGNLLAHVPSLALSTRCVVNRERYSALDSRVRLYIIMGQGLRSTNQARQESLSEYIAT